MIMLIFLVLLIFMVPTQRAIAARVKYGLRTREAKRLSWPSQQLLRQYRALPKDNRPYADIVNILKAMDVKHGVDKINKHFIQRGYERNFSSWEHRCYNINRCEGRDYLSLREGFTQITDALAQQEHALRLSRVAHNLDAIQDLTDRLREERDIINHVTKELTRND